MVKKTLYLECYSGISGDMTVAALLDLGADQEVLTKGLESLHVDGYRIKIGRREKNSIDACDFDVILDSELIHTHEEHTHQHTYSHEHGDQHYSHSHEHSGHDHSHFHDQNDHSHSHSQDQDEHNHMHLGHHEHRNLAEINHIIDASGITDQAKEIAKKIFHIVAVAEAKAHRKPLAQVYFHEVGAVDSIVDIVATAVCLDNLNIHRVIVSELYEGTGQITCQHGILPIPVPAVANIVTAHQLPMHITTVKGELVTPTGAAIVAAIKTDDALPADFKINKIGLGAGKRNYINASGILRAMLIEATEENVPQYTQDKAWVLEANIDDCGGEALSYAMELLFKDGAKDVYYTPIYMKKNRPAYLLGVICSEDMIPICENIIFTHTSTIGIRRHQVNRSTLNRRIEIVNTPYGEAQVKVCTHLNELYYYPEYESVRTLCQQSDIDYMSMYQLIQSLAKGNNNSTERGIH